MESRASIPKVDRILEWEGIRTALTRQHRPLVLQAIRQALDELRTDARAGKEFLAACTEDRLTAAILDRLHRLSSPRLRRVVNGTGVVIHTNLGRSSLPASLGETLANIACHYSNLEFDLETGERGSRYSLVEPLLCELTGAEAALVVNNNAAAVMLALASLAAGKEVLVSRGELVEIGGSFRIPEVMRLSGALLREVGTTNRTHPADYRAAVGEATGLLLKVHTSNFAQVGFTREVGVRELVAIGADLSLPVMADIGSGCLVDLSPFGLAGEPTVRDYVASGLDVVTFSGDKMLGGPQTGVIVGKRKFIDPMKKHQLLRALRVDKMTLAALEGILRLYRDEREALTKIPTLAMLTVPVEELVGRGRKALRSLRRRLPPTVGLRLERDVSQVGGGALPLTEIPTALIAVTIDGLAPQELERRLRGLATPVIGRISRGQFLLDLRTMDESDLPLVTDALRHVAASSRNGLDTPGA